MKTLAFIGCGFVADYYMQSARHYTHMLKVAGAFDINPQRLHTFCNFYNIKAYKSLEEVLNDKSVDIIVNLTNPDSHYAVSLAALKAGKHTYSEKPLATEFVQAKELYELAKQQNLLLLSAPCSVLSECAQTLIKALQDNLAGRIRLVYAEMDDGMVHKAPYNLWRSTSGAPWPARDEFHVGCTLEHAGYVTTWLTAMFGAAESITAFAASLIPEKIHGEPPFLSPDFSVACITFAKGVVARLTCGIVAPHNHNLMLVGDEGILYVDDTWNYHAPVKLRKFINIRKRRLEIPWAQRVHPVTLPYASPSTKGAQNMDFCRGIVAMIETLEKNTSSVLNPEFCLHNTEIVLAIHNAQKLPQPYKLTTKF